jgi:DNA polymerase-3 subunit gamma/tau
VAEWFSEEDLARFLQIILRTHSELGYKQEQRFLLELGLLKLVHAQRLLPLEQMLSGAELPPATRPAPTGGAPRAPLPPPAARTQTTAPPRTPSSPFAADLARKNTPRSEASSGPPAEMSAAVAAPAAAPAGNTGPLTEAELSNHIVSAAEGSGLFDLANMLRNGEWKLNGGELLVQVADPPVLVQMAFKKEAEQALNTAASAALGRPVRLKINGNAKVAARPPAPSPGPSHATRGRVAEEPIIRKIQEKFGAEIRSVIDYREKD